MASDQTLAKQIEKTMMLATYTIFLTLGGRLVSATNTKMIVERLGTADIDLGTSYLILVSRLS